MKHISVIKALIEALVNSENFHALVVKSAPGWGKSSTISQVLKDMQIQGVSAGSYATPLHIYNLICRNPSAVIILDDSAGLLSDPKAMAVLKAATWESGDLGRQVSWGSTSEKVEQPEVIFSGKLILLTNAIPANKDTEAFLSRCLNYEIQLSSELVKEMLFSAVESGVHYPQGDIAQKIIEFITAHTLGIDLMKVNLRTLKMGYDLALIHPDSWQELLLQLLPKSTQSRLDLSEIFSPGLTVKQQEEKYLAITGKSRRSFYNEKKKRGLTRSYGRR